MYCTMWDCHGCSGALMCRRWTLKTRSPKKHGTMKKALRQTLRAGCIVWRNQKFSPRRRPFPGAQDRQNLISWRRSLPLPTDPVSSYRGNRPTNKHIHKQTGPITIHCAAKLSAQCNYMTTTLASKLYVSLTLMLALHRPHTVLLYRLRVWDSL